MARPVRARPLGGELVRVREQAARTRTALSRWISIATIAPDEEELISRHTGGRG